MAGSVTTTHHALGYVRKLILTCVADAADGSFPDTVLPSIEGRLLALETNPGATAPTALYDITVEDAHGHDVLEGVGANRAAGSTEKAAIVFASTSVHPAIAQSDVLTLKIAGNSVNSAQIVVEIYYALGA